MSNLIKVEGPSQTYYFINPDKILYLQFFPNQSFWDGEGHYEVTFIGEGSQVIKLSEREGQRLIKAMEKVNKQ